MADFVAVLRKTMDGIGDPSPDARQRVYERARATVLSKLNAVEPKPPQMVIDRQIKTLEDAIAVVERDFSPTKKADPLDELEDVFASLNGLKERSTIPLRPSAPPLPRTTTPESYARPTPVAPQPSSSPSTPSSQASGYFSGSASARPVQPAPRPPEPRPVQAAPTPASTFTPRPTAPTQPPKPATPPTATPAPRPEPQPVAKEPDAALKVERESERLAGDAPARSGGYSRLVAAVVALAVLAGAGYGIWVNKDDFTRMVGLTPPGDATSTPLQTEPTPATDTAETPAQPSTDVAAAPASPAGTTPAAATPVTKLTQRLNEDGSEADPGPAGGQAGLGEGTTVAEATTSATAPAAAQAQPTTPPAPTPADQTPPADAAPATPDAAATPPSDGSTPPADTAQTPPADTAQTPPADTAQTPPAEPANPPADQAAAAADTAAPAGTQTTTTTAQTDQSLAVAQKAIFYEERTSNAQGSAEPGTTVWSLVQESPGGDKPPEAAIRAEATIPGKDVQLRMTIRRNADPTLPASHIIEMIFLTPDNFEGGGVDNVLRLAMKSSEQDAGSPVIGIPAKISDGFFLIALNDNKAEIDANMNLLQRQSWIDIPLVYKSGRRALITMEKGVPGEKVFDEAMKAWGVNTSG